MKDPKQKVILVTGASSGIGKACFEYLSGQGHIVYGTSRKVIRAQGMIKMNVTVEKSIKKAIDQIMFENSRLDVLINNAGISLVGAIEDTSLIEAQNIIDTNFWGVVNMIHTVLPIMRSQKSGLIINISSIGGLFAIPFQAYYSASKFAVEALTESLRMEIKTSGVSACLIEPGDFRTEISQNRIIAKSSQDTGPYTAGFQSAMNVIVNGEAMGDNPIKIARLIATIIQKKRPRVRYSVGKPLDLLAAKLKQILPQKWFEKLIADHYGL